MQIPMAETVRTFQNEFRLQLKALFAQENMQLESDSEASLLIYERENLLLTRVATLLWLERERADFHPRIKEVFILEELVTCQYIDDIFLLSRSRSKGNACPVIVKLMRQYYALDMGQQ